MKKIIILILCLLLTSAEATVSDTETKRQYFVCNGSTTTYTFTMECNSSDDIRVEKRLISTGVPTSLIEDTDYTIANTGDSYLEGGVVTIDPALASTYSVVIIREIVQTQETVAGAITPATVVLALDKTTRLAQDARNDIDQRVLRIPDSDPSTAYIELANSVSRAGYWLGFDSTTGAPFAGTPAATGISVSAFMITVNDDGDAATVRNTLGGGISFDVDKYASFSVALADIGSTAGELHVYSTQTVTTDETVPATLHLIIHKGGSLGISSTKTVTINKFSADLYQVFSGAGSVSFGSGAAKRYYSEWFGATGDGSTNDYAAWNNLMSAYPAGAEIVLGEGKDYKLNTAASLDFARKCLISGLGQFTIGTTVGERSAIKLSGAGTVVRDISIVGDITTWANTASEYYVSLGIFADDLTIDNVKISNSIFAIKGSGYDNLKFINCSITTTLDVDTAGTVRNAAGIYLVADCDHVLIRGNYFSGYGEAIESGVRNKNWIIADNTFEKQGDQGMYVTGSCYTITGNTFRDQTNHGVKAYAENIVVSNNAFYATGSYTPSGAISLNGMLVATGHVADSDNNTSHDMIVSDNTVMGDFDGNIIIVQPYHSEDSGYSNVTISDNIISAQATTATAVTGNRGIILSAVNDLGTMDLITHGASITGNVIKGCFNGLSVGTGSSGKHMFANISNNVIYAPTFLSFSLTGLQKSVIRGNIATNPIGTVATPVAFTLTNCTYNTFEGNYCGNTSGDGGQQDYAFQTGTGNGYNHFVNNRIEGIANFANHYKLDDATDTITLDLVRTRDLAASGSFYAGEGTKFFIDPVGGARNYNPADQFPTGYELTLINTADAAETITFDSGTLAEAVAQNNRGIFIYSGTAWVKIYVGS